MHTHPDPVLNPWDFERNKELRNTRADSSAQAKANK